MKTDDLLNEIEVPADLESKLETLIDRLDKEEKRSKQKAKRLRLWTGSIAASIAVLISVGLYVHSSDQTDISGISRNDTEKTCREAEKALVLVSQNFNKGLEQWAMVSDEMDKANIIIDKTIKTLKK